MLGPIACLSGACVSVRFVHLARELDLLVPEEPRPVEGVESEEEERHQDAARARDLSISLSSLR